MKNTGDDMYILKKGFGIAQFALVNADCRVSLVLAESRTSVIEKTPLKKRTLEGHLKSSGFKYYSNDNSVSNSSNQAPEQQLLTDSKRVQIRDRKKKKPIYGNTFEGESSTNSKLVNESIENVIAKATNGTYKNKFIIRVSENESTTSADEGVDRAIVVNEEAVKEREEEKPTEEEIVEEELVEEEEVGNQIEVRIIIKYLRIFQIYAKKIA